MTTFTNRLRIETIYSNDKIKELSLKYGTKGSACADLCADISEPLTLQPGEFKLVSSGVRFNIPFPGIVGLVFPRSGLGCKGVNLKNTVGVIDSDYQGDVKIPVVNTSDKPIVIEPYMRIAQIGFFPVIQAVFEPVSEFENKTDRGANGFGSTGTGNGAA